MSTTANSTEGAANIDAGWVASVFIKTVEAEQRFVLMEKLINKGLGLNEVEAFFGNQAEKCRNIKNKSRKENLIMFTMKDKYRDIILEREEWRRRKARTTRSHRNLPNQPTSLSKV